MAIIFAGNPADVGVDAEVLFESALISLMKYFPCIYDSSHPDYNNMQQNKIAWSKLSTSLQKSVTGCINKWYALLQIFLCLYKQLKDDDSCSLITWHHFRAMLKLRPKNPVTYAQLMQEKPPFWYSKPVALQKDVLINQMDLNRKHLLSVYVSLEQKQRIWLQITDILNSFHGAMIMPMIKWQKFWCDLKQNIIYIKRLNSTKTQFNANSIDFSNDDIKILSLFGAKPTDTLEEITAALGGSLEIDCDMEKVVLNCCRCSNIIEEGLNQKFCEACGKLPNKFCDICLRIYQTDLTVYKVKDWNAVARSILPPHLTSFTTISACTTCSTDFKRQAGPKWVTCRICESYIHPLDNLFSAENEVLRKAFMDATNITFSETDGLPSYICRVCKVQMQQFNNFYLKFNRVQTRLRDIQDEFFIGFPGLVLTKNVKQTGNSNLSAAVNRVNILKSNLNALSESGNNEHLNNGKPPAAASAGVQKFTISASAMNCPNVQNTKKTKAKQNAVPPTTGESSNPPIILNRLFVPQTILGVGSMPTNGNGVGTDKPIITQIPPTLQIIKGLPPGTNIKAQQKPPAPLPSNVTVRPKTNRPILPKIQPCVNIPVTAAPSNKYLNIKPVNVRTSGAAPLPTVSIPASAKETPSVIRTINANSSTVSGIIAKQMSSTPMLSSITIKTKSGTTTLSPATSNFQVNTSKPGTASASVNIQYNVQCRKTVSAQPKLTEPKPTAGPTVFKIPDDMFDPNSPPAFCIPKSVKNMPKTPGFNVLNANPEMGKAPANKPAPQTTTPSIVEPPEIKTEVIDEDEYNLIPVRGSQSSSSKGNMPTNSSTSYQKSTQPPSNSVQSKSQSLGTQSTPPPPPPQQLPTAGSKRPRKYWGAVDEFHIPSKIPNQTQSSANETCSQIEIKEELVDPEEYNAANKNTEASNSETFSMFYSDAFELGNVSLDADVTNVLRHMIAHHQSSTDNETYQFTNPSFMTPCNETPSSAKADGGNVDIPRPSQVNTESTAGNDKAAKDKVKVELKPFVHSKAQQECKPNKESKSHVEVTTQRELKTKNDGKVKVIPKENKINSNSTKSKKFHLKKLRIKLKRSKKLQSLVLAAIGSKVTARSCTITRRKSVRLTKNML